MSENNETQTQEATQSVADKVAEMQKNMISKDKYANDINKANNEINRLLDIIKTGGEVNEDEQHTTDELRGVLASKNTNNLEYVKSTLALRQKQLDETGEDIFEAKGHMVDKQIVNGERVATFLQECVDKSDGNSEVFTAILSSNLIETRKPK